MNPAEYQPLAPEVHDFVDGRLSSMEEEALLRRLDAEPELARRVGELRASIEALRDLPGREPPPGFDQRVIGRIREEELAERARGQIRAARPPWWQQLAQFAGGAAAASLLLLLAYGGSPPAPEGDGLTGPALGASPSEDDLLPVLADHATRYEALRRQVAHVSVSDHHVQRRLLQYQLEQSELLRRQPWLQSEIARLPTEQRARHERLVTAMQAALSAMADELDAARATGRGVNLERVRQGLSAVAIPESLAREGRLPAGSRSGDYGRVSLEFGPPDEVELYARVIEAAYRHDHEAVRHAAGAYLRAFPRGQLADAVRLMAVSALLRKGRDREAAYYFAGAFSAYEEDLTAAQRQLVAGLLSDAERARLGIWLHPELPAQPE
jgi:anti-sigma factor RsiW